MALYRKAIKKFVVAFKTIEEKEEDKLLPVPVSSILPNKVLFSIYLLLKIKLSNNY
jgi:hypothetical protein